MLNKRCSLISRPLVKGHLPLFTALLSVAIAIALALPVRATTGAPDGAVSHDTAVSATAWHPLSNLGLFPRVRDMVLVGSDLYVGGQFTQTGDGAMTNLGRVARYDTLAGTWHALANQGLNAEVTAVAVVGSDLYAGGSFTQTADGAVVGMGHVARYDTTAGTWHVLPNGGLNGTIFAMAVVGSDLYVGGTFTGSGDGSLTNLDRIARYDTANPGWHALPNDGLNGNVYALVADGSDLYAGGGFTGPGDMSALILNHVARCDTTIPGWHALPNQGLNGDVHALMVSGSDLYVGGNFSQTGNGAVTNLDHVARYDTAGGAWHGLSHEGLNGIVSALTMVAGTLYVGGQFTETGDGAVTNLGYIARYDTAAAAWEALPHQGLNSWVYVLVATGGDLYVGGEFNQTGDGAVGGLNCVAQLDMRGNKGYLPLVLRF